MKLFTISSRIHSRVLLATLLATSVPLASAQRPCQPSSNAKAALDPNGTCESEPPPFRLSNIAGRALVQQDERALFGGFIIGGALPLRVVIRGIGPSLTSDDDSPLKGRLLDPTLELRGGSGELIAENDNWASSPQASQIRATGLEPVDDKEAAIVARLEPGTYTAVLRGINGTQGIGIVEIYDLRESLDAQLANLASRAFVGTGDDVLIGGLIVNGGPAKRVLLRAIGSSLADRLPDALQDPMLEVINAEGTKVGENDDWREGNNEAEIEGTGAAPTDERESAVAVSLGAGSYTATVRGKNNGTGVGVVEIYRLE